MSFHFFLEKDILRKFVVASLSRLLPRDYKQPPAPPPIYPPPPPLIFEASSRKQPPHFMRFADIFTLLFAVLQNFSYLFQISSGYCSQRQWRLQEILILILSNRVNTLTPKIYKFSRLISEHFLEEIVQTICF